jgi:hypothetical protein
VAIDFNPIVIPHWCLRLRLGPPHRRRLARPREIALTRLRFRASNRDQFLGSLVLQCVEKGGFGRLFSLRGAKQGFLPTDDGPIAGAFLKRYGRAKLFNPRSHGFNPLEGITYQKTREFASIIFGSGGQRTDEVIE